MASYEPVAQGSSRRSTNGGHGDGWRTATLEGRETTKHADLHRCFQSNAAEPHPMLPSSFVRLRFTLKAVQ